MVLFDAEKETARGVWKKFQAKFPHKAEWVLLQLFEEYITTNFPASNPFRACWLEVVKDVRAANKANMAHIDEFLKTLQ